jgi:hypothetical protein
MPEAWPRRKVGYRGDAKQARPLSSARVSFAAEHRLDAKSGLLVSDPTRGTAQLGDGVGRLFSVAERFRRNSFHKKYAFLVGFTWTG